MSLKGNGYRWFIERGKRFMSTFILALKESFNSFSPFTIDPDTDYRKRIPKSPEQIMRKNWETTGGYLRKAMEKVGEEIGEKEQRE